MKFKKTIAIFLNLTFIISSIISPSLALAQIVDIDEFRALEEQQNQDREVLDAEAAKADADEIARQQEEDKKLCESQLGGGQQGLSKLGQSIKDGLTNAVQETFRQALPEELQTILSGGGLQDVLNNKIQQSLPTDLTSLVENDLRNRLRNSLSRASSGGSQPSEQDIRNIIAQELSRSLQANFPTALNQSLENNLSGAVNELLISTSTGITSALERTIQTRVPQQLERTLPSRIQSNLRTDTFSILSDQIQQDRSSVLSGNDISQLTQNLNLQDIDLNNLAQQIPNLVGTLLNNIFSFAINIGAEQLLNQNLSIGELVNSEFLEQIVNDSLYSVGGETVNLIEQQSDDISNTFVESITKPHGDQGTSALEDFFGNDTFQRRIDSSIQEERQYFRGQLSIEINKTIEQNRNDFDALFNDIANQTVNQITNIPNSIVNQATGQLDSLVNDITNQALQSVTAPLNQITGQLTGSVNGVLNNLTQPINTALNDITGNLTNSILSPVTGAVDQMFGQILDPIDGALGGLTEAITAPLDGLVGQITSPINNLVGGITDQITGQIQGITNQILSPITNGLGQLTNMITAPITGALNTALGTITGGLINLGNPLGALGIGLFVPVLEQPGTLTNTSKQTESNTGSTEQNTKEIIKINQDSNKQLIEICTKNRALLRINQSIENKELVQDVQLTRDAATEVERYRQELLDFVKRGYDSTGQGADSPLYIENTGTHLKRVAEEAKNVFLDDLKNSGNVFKEQVANTINNSLGGFSQSTITKRDYDRFKAGQISDPEEWNRIFVALNDPFLPNNPSTALRLSREELNTRQGTAVTNAREEILTNQGYLPVRECLEYTSDGQTCRRWSNQVPAIQVKEAVADAMRFRVEQYTNPQAGAVAPGNQPLLDEIRTLTPSTQGGGGSGAAGFKPENLLSLAGDLFQTIRENLQKPSLTFTKRTNENSVALNWNAKNMEICRVNNNWFTQSASLRNTETLVPSGSQIALSGQTIIPTPIQFEIRANIKRGEQFTGLEIEDNIQRSLTEKTIKLPENTNIETGDSIIISWWPYTENYTIQIDSIDTNINNTVNRLNQELERIASEETGTRSVEATKYRFLNNVNNISVRPIMKYQISCIGNDGQPYNKEVSL